jgi:AraC-like DNA-binding protein
MKSEVMAKNAMENESEETNKASQLSQEIIDDLLRKLEKFERNKDYLNSNISLMALAKKFNTNSSYLSRVLNSSKSINFSQYLNDLRIDYAVNQMKNDAVFRKYTIEAIAIECGYNNSASFSRSFYKKTGLHPSYFINEIIKDQKAL